MAAISSAYASARWICSALTVQTGELLEQSVKEARRVAATARRKARGRGARASSARRQRSTTACGEKITDRMISLADPDARPSRKGKLGKPTEFGYVAQIAEITRDAKTGPAA
jgi:IS5 family transposase